MQDITITSSNTLSSPTSSNLLSSWDFSSSMLDELEFDLNNWEKTDSEKSSSTAATPPLNFLGPSEPPVVMTLTTTRRYRRKIPKKNEDHKYRKVEGRKRKINPSYMPALRVLKKDIRRKYQEMYTNVINQHDAPLLEKFLAEFCHPDCQYHYLMPSAPAPLVIGRGLGEILFGLIQLQLKIPDSIYRFTDVEIHVPYHVEGSSIVSNGFFQGTKVFELPFDPLADAVQREIMTSNNAVVSYPTSSIFSPSNARTCAVLIHGQTFHITADAAARLGREAMGIEAEEALMPSMLHPEGEDTDDSSSGDGSHHPPIEEFSPLVTHELLPKLQTLQLYPLLVPQQVALEGVFSMNLDTDYRIASFQYAVKKVVKQAIYPLPQHDQL